MAQFFNQATLSYNGTSTTSNVTVGELLEVLSVSKRAVSDGYRMNDPVTYAISIVNAGPVAFNNLTVTDNLGAYADGETTRVPLTYVPGSIVYYVNGVVQPAPTVDTDEGLVISGVNVPASGNAILLYEAVVNRYAPVQSGSTITNTAVITGGGLSAPLTAEETITVENRSLLTISKSICPSIITENGQITYTFVIQNSGNTPAAATDSVSVTDLFNPILDISSVTLNGITLSEPEDYSYNVETGLFTTVPGKITVDAATYSRDEATGTWIINPGVSVLTVIGTI